MTQASLCEHASIPPALLGRIISGKRRITADIAWKLGAALGTGPRYWMIIRAERDLWLVRP
jgi:addiction module HigA family antidote